MSRTIIKQDKEDKRRETARQEDKRRKERKATRARYRKSKEICGRKD